jgi:predicted ATPase
VCGSRRCGQRFAPQHSAEDLLSLEGGGDEVAYRGGHLSRAQSSGDFLIERFLEAVQVRGFRGVGPTATVSLQPNTGLTIFMGRNGFGKSSIAEAVEHTLTEDAARWAQQPPAIRDGWRNLHHNGMPDIKLTLRLATGAKVTIRRTWPADTAARRRGRAPAQTAQDPRRPSQGPQSVLRRPARHRRRNRR